MLLAGTSTGSVTAGTVTAVGTLNYSWKNASNTEYGFYLTFLLGLIR
jgi:hypothetical protein